MKKTLSIILVSVAFSFLFLQATAHVIASDESNFSTVPAAESNSGTVPAAESNSGTVPAAESNSGIVPAAESNSGIVPAAESNSGIVPATGATSNCGPNEICNPLNVNSIQDLISVAIKFVVNLLAIAGGIYIIWTGFLFVKAQGNPKELETAKKSFMNAIIGMAIILGAWGIAVVISNTINQITKNHNGALSL
jgi:Type IV secretion system pilin